MRQEESPEELVNDLRRMHIRIGELERQLAEAMNGKLPEDQQIDPSMLMISSMVSSRTREPMVMLRWFTFVAQIEPEQARELAFNLLDAVEAAKSDAFLMQFMSRISSDPQAGAQLVGEFRKFRQQQAA